jgi:hypothetical protein
MRELTIDKPYSIEEVNELVAPYKDALNKERDILFKNRKNALITFIVIAFISLLTVWYGQENNATLNPLWSSVSLVLIVGLLFSALNLAFKYHELDIKELEPSEPYSVFVNEYYINKAVYLNDPKIAKFVLIVIGQSRKMTRNESIFLNDYINNTLKPTRELTEIEKLMKLAGEAENMELNV